MCELKETRYVRVKESEKDSNTLTIISMIQLLIKNEDGKVIQVSPHYHMFKNYELDNVPYEISMLQELNTQINREEFDHLMDLYENKSTDYILFNK